MKEVSSGDLDLHKQGARALPHRMKTKRKLVQQLKKFFLIKNYREIWYLQSTDSINAVEPITQKRVHVFVVPST